MFARFEKSDDEPKAEHQPDAIRERIKGQEHRYLGDTILGAIDGGVTTFAVIAGAVGSSSGLCGQPLFEESYGIG